MSSAIPPWSGKRVQEARRLVAGWLPAECHQCGRMVTREDSWVIEHIKSRAAHPELTWVVSNWSVSHRACSDRTGQAAVIEKAKRDALREAGFSREQEAGTAPPLKTFTSPEPTVTANPVLAWSNPDQLAPAWIPPIPEDFNGPLYCTPPHPDACGSYGADAEEWAREELGVTLRPWQSFALRRALEHRADGSLCWRNVVLSCARRAGKSVLLYVLLMYRVTHGFEPQTEAILTAKNVNMAREIMRRAWRYADAAEGWKPTRANGREEVETPGGDRIMLRADSATAGYSPSLAVADEAWGIKPTFIDDDLGPALLEREGGGQLWLVSTAHRRATSLMRGRISTALAYPDDRTLLLLWGAPEGADPADPEVWRAASPYWTQDRADMMTEKYNLALAGEADPEFDDPDPLQGFACQFLNQWPLTARRELPGDPLTTEEDWSRLTTIPTTQPAAVAVESWFGEGVSVAYAYAEDSRTILQTSDHPDLASAAQAIRNTGYTGQVVVGSSLLADPAFKGIRTKAGQGRTSQAVQALARLLQDDALRHTGDPHLTEQVLAVRTTPGADGPRLASKGRADAIKAASWAANAARTAKKYGGVRQVLTSAK